jgi:hypothetical protein
MQRTLMSHFSLAIAFLAFALPTGARAEWYAIRGKPTTTLRLQAEGKVVEVPVRKIDLPATALVLRRDTEDAKRYWVEITLTEPRDSGDGYLLAFGDVVLSEIYTRANRWAIGFTSLEQARRCFAHLRKLHQFDSEHAKDRTKR